MVADDVEAAVGEGVEGFADDVAGAEPEGRRDLVAVGAEDVVELGVGEAGAESLDGDAGGGAAHFEIEAFAEGGHPGLGGAVADVFDAAAEAGDGGDVDDAAGVAGGHGGEDGAAEADGGEDVEAVHLHLAVEGGFVEEAFGAEAGVVDEEVGAGGFKAGGDAFEGGLGGEVFDEGIGVAELGGELAEAVLAAGDEKEIVAAGAQLPRELRADAGRCAGYDCECHLLVFSPKGPPRMSPLQFTTPWAPAWALPALLFVAAPFLYYSRQTRVFLPFLAILAYWAAAAIGNRRHVEVTAAGVTIRDLPLPVGFGASLPRAAIARVSSRSIGPRGDLRFAVSVELTGGRRVDLHRHYRDFDEAQATAREAARVLGGVEHRHLPPEEDDWALPRGAVGAWVAAAAVALAAGARFL